MISSQQSRVILDWSYEFQNQDVHSSHLTHECESDTKLSTVFLNLDSDVFSLSTANDTELITLYFECVSASRS